MLGLVSSIVWLVAAVSILLNERYAESFWNFQQSVIHWEARLLAYLASLIEPYPPDSFDTGSTEPSTTTESSAGLEPSA
jgi:hypothetical protein